ncbi:MAG: MGMT family protein [Acidimicrobiales bacterium]
MADFDHAVAEVVLGLAEGEVVSYGWVAAAAGYPGRARGVGRFLSQHGHGLPWWRVVRADGSLAAPKPDRQAAALQAEGVTVVDNRVRAPLPRR